MRHKPAHPPANQCPTGWRMAPLSSVAEIRFSNVDKKSETGEIPVRLCNYTDAYNNDYITAYMEFMRATASRSEISRFGLAVGDVIITKDSETPDDIGVPALVDGTAADLVCGYHLALIRVTQCAIDPTFLAKQLAQPRIARYYGQQANGSTRYGLSTAAIERTPLWIPPIDQQMKIGEVARLVDKAIKDTATLITKVMQIRVGLLCDLFNRGLDDNGEIRDPLAHPEQFKDSPLGRIPKEWGCGELARLVSPDRPIVYGILMPGRGFPGGIPVIKVKDIRNGRIDTASLLHTDPKIDEAYSRSRVRSGDLLFTIRGTVGRMALVPPALDGANITQDTARIALADSNPTFVARWLEMEAATRFVAVHTLGVAVQGINLRDVRRIPIIVVPRREQDRIAAMIESLEARIDNERATLQKLADVKSGLLADLLAGHRVPHCLESGAML